MYCRLEKRSFTSSMLFELAGKVDSFLSSLVRYLVAQKAGELEDMSINVGILQAAKTLS